MKNFLFLLFVLFIISGCTPDEEKEKIQEDLLKGSWMLTSTRDQKDTVFIGSTLKLSNATFFCNHAFFFFSDSSKKFDPLTGAWYIDLVYYPARRLLTYDGYYTLVFSYDTLERSYFYSRENDSLLYWYNAVGDTTYLYSWKRMK